MSAYRVKFFKNLLSSDGHQFKCLQQQLEIADADNPNRAADEAARRFEKGRGLRSWKACADFMEIELKPPGQECA